MWVQGDIYRKKAREGQNSKHGVSHVLIGVDDISLHDTATVQDTVSIIDRPILLNLSVDCSNLLLGYYSSVFQVKNVANITYVVPLFNFHNDLSCYFHGDMNKII